MFFSLHSTLRKPRWLALSPFIARFTQTFLPKEIGAALPNPRTAELTKFPNPRSFRTLEVPGYVGPDVPCERTFYSILRSKTIALKQPNMLLKDLLLCKHVAEHSQQDTMLYG